MSRRDGVDGPTHASTPLIEGKEHLRDIARVADEYALCMDSTQSLPPLPQSAPITRRQIFDQLGKALVPTGGSAQHVRRSRR